MNTCTINSKSLWASTLKYILNLTISQTFHSTTLIQVKIINYLDSASTGFFCPLKFCHYLAARVISSNVNQTMELSCAQTPMASHHPLRPVSKAFAMISLGYFSDIFHCHTFYLGFLYLLYPLSRMFFSPGHQKAHTHISFRSLFRSSPVGEAFLKHYSLWFFIFSTIFFSFSSSSS